MLLIMVRTWYKHGMIFYTKEVIFMQKTVDALLRLGVSKYAISKSCRVSWTTVNMWLKGVFNPDPQHEALLTEFYLKTMDETRKKT